MGKEATKIQEGGVIDYTAGGTIANGDVVPLADRVGVALDDAVSGETISLALDGVFEVTGTTADTFTIGTLAYFDAATRMVTTDAATGSNISCGIAVTAKAGTAAGVVNVKIG